MFVRNPLVFKAIVGVHRVDDVCETRWRVSLHHVACQPDALDTSSATAEAKSTKSTFLFHC